MKIATDVITGAVAQAVEKMAFMMQMPMLEELPAPEKSVHYSIDFTGADSGRIELVAGIDFAKSLAGNMTGLDDLEDEVAMASLGELVNVISGLVLPFIAEDTDDVYDVTIPKSEDGNWESFCAGEDVRIMNIEDFPVAVKLSIN